MAASAPGAALGLVEKNAEGLVQSIYEEYCQKGGSVLKAESGSAREPASQPGEIKEELPSIEGDQTRIPADSKEGSPSKSSSNLDNL
jgi:hypothetical protein